MARLGRGAVEGSLVRQTGSAASSCIGGIDALSENASENYSFLTDITFDFPWLAGQEGILLSDAWWDSYFESGGLGLDRELFGREKSDAVGTQSVDEVGANLTPAAKVGTSSTETVAYSAYGQNLNADFLPWSTTVGAEQFIPGVAGRAQGAALNEFSALEARASPVAAGSGEFVDTFKIAQSAAEHADAFQAYSAPQDNPSQLDQASVSFGDGAEPFVTQGGKWGPSDTFGTTGGVVSWSIMAGGLTEPGGFTTVNMSSFLSFDFEAQLRLAFDTWSAVADIEFIQVQDGGGALGADPFAEIRIGGGFIDGPFNILAVAFFPDQGDISGDMFFDSGETTFWTEHSFFLTAAHEIGHSIGLNHETVNLALMNPIFNSSLNGLQQDDIDGATTIYGIQDFGTNIYNLPGLEMNLDIFDAPPNAVINGNSLGNTINGSGAGEAINGLSGNDVINGNGGNDTLDGGGGGDGMAGGFGDDTFIVDNVGDTVIELAGEGTDTVRTSISYTLPDNVENLNLLNAGGGGAPPARTLTGNVLANTLVGADGADTLNGLGGNDTLSGGIGDDWFNAGFLDGDDTLTGGSGFDTLDFSGVDGAIQVNQVAGTTTGSAENDTLLDVFERVIGTDFNDALSGGHGISALFGGGGNDLFFGNRGDDLMRGGDGNDRFFFSWLDGDDRMEGGNGFDILDYSGLGGAVQVNQLAGTTTGTAGNDTLLDVFEQVVGTSFGDVLSGGHGINSLNGGGGDDQIFANNGNDWVTGGTGVDTITLGVGDDTFQFFDGDGDDTITDFDSLSANEVINVTRFSLTNMSDFQSVTQSGVDVVIQVDADDSITLLGVNLADLDNADFVF